MSLIAWYPLKDDIKDYSLEGNDLINSSPTDIVQDSTNGKLGKCYNFDGTGYLSSKNKISYTKGVTYSAWVYYNTTGTILGIVNNYNNSGSTGYNASIAISALGNLIVGVPDKDSTGSSVYTSSGIVSPNIWTHVCITIDTINGNINFYINGNYIDTIIISASDLPVILADREILIGQWSWNYITGHPYKGKLNDVRVYDKILTKKQIREMYKTCILNYSFNDPYAEPTTNLFPIDNTRWFMNKSNYQGNHTLLTIDDEGWIEMGAHFTFAARAIEDSTGWQVAEYITDLIAFDTSKQYTLSFDIKILNLTELTVKLARSNGTQIICTVPTSLLYSDYSEWKRFSYTFIPLLAAADASVDLYIRSNTDDADFMIANIQLEKKDHETPFSNGVRDGILSDNSGYGNDSSIGNSMYAGYISDSKLGIGAYKFQDICISSSNPVPLLSEYTISFWAKINSSQTSGIGSIISISLDSSKYPLWIYTDGASLLMSAFTNTYPNKTIDISSYIDIWAFYTVTIIKGGTCNLYINGILIGSFTAGTTEPDSGSHIYLGDLRIDRGLYFSGYIDDLRMYATILTNEDILNLYKSRFSFDLNGDLYCDDIDQFSDLTDGTFSYNKKGIMYCNAIDQRGGYGMDYMELDDGSQWVKIFHHRNHSGTVLFVDDTEALRSNTEDKFSDLYLLELFRATDGKFEFLMQFPDDLTGYNRWKQISNPTVVTIHNNGVNGYEAILISWASNNWGGLEYNGSVSFIDGSVASTTWHYAIGSYTIYASGIPGPTAAVQYTELWVRIDTVDIDTNKIKISRDNILMCNGINQ